MTLYQINATVTTMEKNGKLIWSCVRQIPRFYLSASVQGIVDEKHAEKIACDIICPGKLKDGVTIFVSAYKIEV